MPAPALRLLSLLLVLLAAGLGALVATLPSARAQSESGLRDRVAREAARERSNGSAAARLRRLEQAMEREVAVVQRRLDAVQAQYDAAAARLAQTRTDLRHERMRLSRLQRRLRQGRTVLADNLRQSYMQAPPDLTAVVMQAHGFSDLLESFEFLRRVSDANTEVVTVVRRARVDARRTSERLETLEAQRARTARELGVERAGIAEMRNGLAAREQQLAAARAAREAAASASRAKRRSAERALSRLERERERARAAAFSGPGAPQGRAGAPASAGPGGPWAIPWAIVQCESGGQNFPPNAAGASGYYQFMPKTWRNLGGSTPHAYQASKAEQDRLAARLWAGGAGAGNWDCAAIVGYRR